MTAGKVDFETNFWIFFLLPWLLQALQCQRFAAAELSWRAAGTSVGDVGAVVAVSILVVNDEQDDAQEEADGAHGDVGDAQERVLAPHPGDGAQDHPLPALEAADGIIWDRRVKGRKRFKGSNGPRANLYISFLLFYFLISKPFQTCK